jgi:haloalkane dehalogenase
MEIPQAIKALFPFASRWTEVQGHRIHYVDEGDQKNKPTVVLLHGNPTWSFLYREIIPLITHKCRAVAFDYVGMGLSDKPEDEGWYTLENHTRVFTEFIQKQRFEKLILVFQDWGGPIAFGHAMAHPEQLAGMVIMNTWAWPEPSPFHASVLPWRMLHAPVIGAHLFLRRNVLIERGLYMSTGTKEKMKEGAVLDGYRLPFSSPGSRIAMLAFPRNIPLKPGDLNWERMTKMKEALPTFRFPCRLLWGERDDVFPPENAHKFHHMLPNCTEPRMIPHGRHFIQEDAPKEIAEEILALVAQSDI